MSALPAHAKGIDQLTGEEDREVRYSYSADGQVELVRYGSDTTRADLGPLDEQCIYDGFRQLKTFRDRGGTSWQVAYTPLGDVSAVKQSNSPYGSTNPPRAEWEIRTAYNDLRVPRARNLHGLIEESYDYDEALNPVRVRRRLHHRSVIGEFMGLKFPDIPGSTGYERVLSGSLDRFREALSNGQITSRRKKS